MNWEAPFLISRQGMVLAICKSPKVVVDEFSCSAEIENHGSVYAFSRSSSVHGTTFHVSIYIGPDPERTIYGTAELTEDQYADLRGMMQMRAGLLSREVA